MIPNDGLGSSSVGTVVLGGQVKEGSIQCWVTQGRAKAGGMGANWVSGVDLGARVMRT